MSSSTRSRNTLALWRSCHTLPCGLLGSNVTCVQEIMRTGKIASWGGDTNIVESTLRRSFESGVAVGCNPADVTQYCLVILVFAI
ncbi:hypothetical protein L226DRAFT_538432 [Lentinus tigrinus ALCF2SS1-7]|uniref:uncharacterized protein n=1 Tax=Lentinus tigrinus ALCF2SS1-7 TaxID=1328758 RepID=UPI001165E331|nr:hypothetical protein L226DRAFT_538432 [Lentinus tigrinus ALCF2SS1-7]